MSSNSLPCSVSPGLIWSVSAWGWNCQPSVSVCWPEKARLGVERFTHMWKMLAPQLGLYKHQPEDPHRTGPVLRAQELVAQNCGQGSIQGKQCFIPP